MDSSEFKFNYYFNKYKNYSVIGRKKFKEMFIKTNKNDKINIDKLIYEIEQYQIKKYGTLLDNSSFIPYIDIKTRRNREKARMNYLYGTREEREVRLNAFNRSSKKSS